MKLRHIALLLFPLLVALCSAWGPRIIKGPCPSVTAAGLPSGVALLWVTTNIANNTGVPNWYDTIQSNNLKQASQQPVVKTNGVEGLWFENDPGPYRYATNVQKWCWGPNDTLAICWRDMADQYGNMRVMGGTGSNATPFELTWTISAGQSVGIVKFAGQNLSAIYPLNGVQDIVLVKSNTASNQGLALYTNGVLSSVAVGIDWQVTNGVVEWFGGNNNSAANLNCKVLEVGVWTNINNASDWAMLYHQRRTNLYGL